MSKKGPTNTSTQRTTGQGSVKAFRAAPAKSKPSLATPTRLLLQAGGIGMAGAAIATAVVPGGALTVVAETMDRVGLDKGPMALFGATLFALGSAIAVAERARRAAKNAELAASEASSGVAEIDGQGAILAGVQSELGTIRTELADARREAKETEQKKPGGPADQAQDPLFRLAASLDQLGAQIDKRVDKARAQMVDSVNALAKSIEVGADQTERTAAATKEELEAIRMDVADMRGQLTRVAAEIGEARAAMAGAASAPAPARAPEPSEVPAPLPRELNEAEANPQPVSFEDPPAPIPSAPEPPSDGLGLIDEMEQGTAATTDDPTPPLFPELGE